MPDLPTGTVTFLFTDIEGSTRLWEERPEAMRTALVRHDELLRGAIHGHRGYVFATGGDAFSAAFGSPHDAINAALEGQRALISQQLGADINLAVRMALHTGVAEERDGDYFGVPLNRCARLLSAGSGGQVLLSQATFELVQETPPDSGAYQDLGEHRLKDLARAERVYQLCHSELPADFPALRTLDTYPNNLPIQLTSFVGRSQELAEVIKLLAGARLLTLTGVGGSGKTRLALQMAAELLEEYPGGVWVAELAAVADPENIPGVVVATLGVKERPDLTSIEAIVQHIADQKLLLILDNCEHLIQGAADLAKSLLEDCANLQVAATTREMLGVPGEVAFSVQSLAVPGSSQDREAVARYDAVRLFSERASTAKPGFRLTSDNMTSVVQICRRLDGMPLAIELAAARLRVMSPDQIAGRLDDQFRLLTGGSRTALPRQQTLQATIDWSYDLLDPDERLLFDRLSVFSGGFTMEAAEAVCHGGAVDTYAILDLVARLVGKSLVIADEAADGSVRYRLLETLRQYGAAKLAASGEADELRGAHADYFVEAIEEQQRLAMSGEFESAVSASDADHDNLRAALRFTIDADDPVTAVRILTAIWRYWYHRGLSREGVEWAEEILGSIEGLSDEVVADALHAASALQFSQGNYERCAELADRELPLRRRLGDPEALAAVLNSLSNVAEMQGKFDEQKAYIEEAMELTTDSEAGHPTYLVNLGWNALWRGELEEAAQHFDRGMDLARRRELPQALPWLHMGLGYVAWVRADLELAEAHYTEAAGLARDQRADGLRGLILSQQSLVAGDRGDAAAAAGLLQESLPLVEEEGDRLRQGLWLWAAARAQPSLGDRVRVLASAQAFLERTGVAWSPIEERERERLVEEARQSLGSDTVDELWSDGLRLSREEATAFALEGLSQAPPA